MENVLTRPDTTRPDVWMDLTRVQLRPGIWDLLQRQRYYQVQEY